MPEFGSPFSGLASDRFLTDQELVRAIRFMVAAEYEAIQLYMQLAESTDNELAREVLEDIADRRIHGAERVVQPQTYGIVFETLFTGQGQVDLVGSPLCPVWSDKYVHGQVKVLCAPCHGAGNPDIDTGRVIPGEQSRCHRYMALLWYDIEAGFVAEYAAEMRW